MPILDGPMTIDQMKAWAENTVSKLDIDKCCELRRQLAMSDPHEPRRVYRREG